MILMTKKTTMVTTSAIGTNCTRRMATYRTSIPGSSRPCLPDKLRRDARRLWWHAAGTADIATIRAFAQNPRIAAGMASHNAAMAGLTNAGQLT